MIEINKNNGELFFFTGRECPHCKDMEPLIDKLEKETEINIDKFEVWHNAKNAALLQELDTIGCGGVPFFYNKKTKKAICGSTSYEKLKAWAQGK